MKNQSFTRSVMVLSILLLTFQFAFAYDLVVAKDGTGNYTTVQAAIDAAPSGRVLPYTIYVKNGKYREKISIPSSKTFIQLTGESVANTIIYYDDPAIVLQTQGSASFSINANDFAASNITFANTYGDGSQAVAVLVNGDRAAFKNCRFLGNQDTLYTKGGSPNKCYFKNCYIDGNIDFIFGSSVAIFDSCVIYAKSRPGTSASYITAANTPTGQAYGYLFRNCNFPANTGATSYYLGRPWPSPSEAGTAQKTVLINSTISNSINPKGWSVWNANTITANLTYAEYKSKNQDGTLADVSQRETWSRQFTDADTVGYNNPNMLSGWDPCAVFVGFCSYVPAPIAVSNFRAAKTATNGVISWNISWPKSGITYTLFRSPDNVSFTQLNQVVAANDTAVNFSYTDALPAGGTKYYYYLEASLAGFATHRTDTVLVSSKQTIFSSATALGAFAQSIGTPSATQSCQVSAENLTDNLLITPPVNFEVSNNGTNWYTNAAPLTLVPVSGTVAAFVLQVRLNASALGSSSGNIVLTSTSADPVNIAVTGNTVTSVAFPISLINWPMRANNIDSTAGRSPALQATVPRLNKMVLADGSVAAVGTGYTDAYGQAINSGNAGTGSWTAANGGNGGTLGRTYYEEFTIKPVTGNDLRVDSFVLYSNFYGGASTATNLNYKIALVWSKTGFKNTSSSVDSVDALKYDSSGVDGVVTTGLYTGGFSNAIPLFVTSSSNGRPVSRLAFLLGASLANSGVTVASGDSLTIRIYFSSGSSSTGRYATVKFAQAKGVVTSLPVPVRFTRFSGGIDNGKPRLWWEVLNESNVKEYVVERSVDGYQFVAAGNVAALNSFMPQRYTFADPVQVNAGLFYRIRMMDISGAVHYSTVVRIMPGKIASMQVSPNPVDREMRINYPEASSGAVLSIHTAEGKQVGVHSLQIGSTSAIIPVENLPKGYYILRYSNQGKTYTRGIIRN